MSLFDDDRYKMRWAAVTVYYYIAPYLDTPFVFSTCIERTRSGLIHNEIGIISVVRNLVQLRQLDFPPHAITPQSIYRCRLPKNLRAVAMPTRTLGDTSGTTSASTTDTEDDDDYEDLAAMDEPYRVMAGPELFDAKREAIVLFPTIINEAAYQDGISRVSNDVGAGRGPDAIGGGGGGYAEEDSDQSETEPETAFDHKEYDKGTYIKELETKLKAALKEISEEGEGKDPNSVIFKRIICECFLPWSIPGFKRRPCGILLHGPPGNGKSYMVDSYIRERLGMTFTGLNYASSRFSGGKVGEGERKMRKEAAKCFEDRTKLYCCFIDEIDTVGGDRNRKENEGYKTDYLNQLLAIIGQRNYQNLFVIGATNYKDKLDAALVRDGRLENHYYLPSMDKHRRLDHLSRKLSGAMSSLIGGGVKITTSDVRRVLDNNKPVLGYLVRNTINFTFAQFDRLCSDIEGYLRIHFWARTMNTASALADWLPEISENGFSYGENGLLVLLAKDQMIKTCLDGTVKTAVDSYFKGNSMENLAYNRVALDTSASNDVVSTYNREVKEYFVRESQYHSAACPPTGRFIVNVSTVKNKYPEFLVELARNPCLTSNTIFSTKRIQLKNVFFNDRMMSKMIQPLVQARGYEFIQIIDRETVQLDEEDKIYETLKGKYAEAKTLAENGTAGLVIIRLNDLVGHITQVLWTKTTMVNERKAGDFINAIEKLSDKQLRKTDEDQEKLNREMQIREALEGAFNQSMVASHEMVEAAEERMESNNQAVATKKMRATENERESDTQEQIQKVTDTKTERMAEFHNAIQRQVYRQVREQTTKQSEASSMENKIQNQQTHDLTNETEDRMNTQNTAAINLERDETMKNSTQKTNTMEDQTHTQGTTSTTNGNTMKNSNEGTTDSTNASQIQAGNRDDTKGDMTQQAQNQNQLQNQGMHSNTNANQTIGATSLTDTSVNSSQNQHQNSNVTTNTQQNQDSTTLQNQNIFNDTNAHQDTHSHLDQSNRQDNSGDNNILTHVDSDIKNDSAGVNNTNHTSTQNGYTGQTAMVSTNNNDHNDTTYGSATGGRYDNITSDTGKTLNYSDNMMEAGWNPHGADDQPNYISNFDGSGGAAASDRQYYTQTNTDEKKGNTFDNSGNVDSSQTSEQAGQNQNTKGTNNSEMDAKVTGSQWNSSNQQGTNSSIGTSIVNGNGGTSGNDTSGFNNTFTTTNTGNTQDSNGTTATNSNQLQDTSTNTFTGTDQNTHQNQTQNTENGTTTVQQQQTGTQTGTTSEKNSNSQSNTTDDFRGNNNTGTLSNKTNLDHNLESVLQNQNKNESSRQHQVSNKLANVESKELNVRRQEQNLFSQSRTHGVTDTLRDGHTEQQSHTVTNSVTNSLDQTLTEADLKELNNEVKQEGERSKLLQEVAEESIRGVLNAEASKLLEQGLSEEYRQTMSQNMTGREQINHELKNEENMKHTQLQHRDSMNMLTKTLTSALEHIESFVEKILEEFRSTLSDESRREDIVKDEFLRPKIMDVIGRFVGGASKYLNSFDIAKGPDTLFIVEDDSLLEMLKLAIQWGELKPSRPTHSMSIPDLFLTKHYEDLLNTFWVDALSGGKLTNIKIVLTAAEKDRTTGFKPFDHLPSFIQLPVINRGIVADCLKTVEFEGCFAITDSTFYKKHAKFLNALPNLTKLRLVNMNLSGSPFQGTRRLKSEEIGLICPNLVEIDIIGSRLPTRAMGLGQNAILSYDVESLLCFLTGAHSIKDVKLPKLTKMGMSYPRASLANKGRKHVFELIGNPSVNFMRTLRSLNLAKQMLTWSAFETCLSEVGKNLHSLVVENCVIADFNFQLAMISRFVDTQLPEKLRASVRRPAQRKAGTLDFSSSDNDEDYFVNGHNIKPDVIYYLTMYFVESKRDAVMPRGISFVGY